MQEKLKKYFFKILDKFIGDDDTIIVALSGGSDSMCLTLLANEWATFNKKRLIAVTVDHQLREESTREANTVHSYMEKIGIHHVIKPWIHEEVPINKLEILAREARYKILIEVCKENNSRFLLLGHNLNEQIETFLMRKERKSGYSGLAAMSVIRTIANNVFAIRPCLSFSKKVMQEYLITKGVSWVEDPMNRNDIFFRVKFRNQLKKMPISEVKSVLNQLLYYGQSRENIESSTVKFLKEYCKISNFGFASVDESVFQSLTGKIKYEILKRIVKSIGGMNYGISDADCKKILDSNYKITVGNVIFKKMNKQIVFVRENRNLFNIKVTERDLIWDNRFKIEVDPELTGGDIEIGPYNIKKNIDNYKLNNEMLLPSYIIETLPALFIAKKVMYVYNNNMAFDKFRCEFLPKVDFFDVFCCIDKRGVLL